MACARNTVDDQIGRIRTADLSCSTWSTVHSLLPPTLPSRSEAAAPVPGKSTPPLLLMMQALFRNLSGFKSNIAIYVTDEQSLSRSCLSLCTHLNLSVGTVSLQSLR
ncbi:hypothetical protein CFC21_048145 [Triticum aestivum]|uniref:Uncharacterized protein n=2 Tax=Triticum aestivum TaxID=4565 RepID=A0A3B6GWH9_WHEAT|nr:hypothetical protein CFC21_048145 [Triticum aestivum]